ncbi:alpha/beta fold hydrolase [Peribacillus frigoritolerans]|uniref:alpha/beta fold hydrolase n=1 Tax=Peribacillus frigoritolerans TaxID=450367 RepID=UPI00256FC216|nr:alpha/beta hydrolase [Peribacillus frigoritolerans]
MKIKKITRNILLIIAAVLCLWFIFHHVMTIFEQKKYQAAGELVEVDGKKMHVYTKGDGENTIVLLSGLGTAAPVLDFEPLINELAKHNKIVVAEPFGYGWSDLTNKKRTVENIVEELRTALKNANIEGPYILMPHSVSGIYTMYYANKYPEEIKGIIGIDLTLPKALEYFNESPPKLPKYLSFIARTGIARLALSIIPNDFLPIAHAGTYSEENLKMTKTISAWKGYNQNVVNEANELKNNIKKTKDISFPPNIPVMIFTPDKKEANGEGRSNRTFYQTQLRNVAENKLVILDGHHYLHWTRYKDISDHVKEFIIHFE